jgi:hypothetical protein
LMKKRSNLKFNLWVQVQIQVILQRLQVLKSFFSNIICNVN